MFNRSLFNRVSKGTRSYSSCNYHYMMSPFSASIMTVSLCFLIGLGIRNDIRYLYHQQEEIKKMVKELKDKKP